jgi:hypothetical protein
MNARVAHPGKPLRTHSEHGGANSGGRQPFSVRRNVMCQLDLDQVVNGSENLLVRHRWQRSRTPGMDRNAPGLCVKNTQSHRV